MRRHSKNGDYFVVYVVSTTMERLKPSLKSYDWGLPSLQSVVHLFNKEEAEKVPICAEAWWGSHKSGPAYFTGHEGLCPLQDVAYLLKVISVGKPLSLQVHPDKLQAVELNAACPEVYTDANEKSEVVVALTPFTALCGFLPDNVIDSNLQKLQVHKNGWRSFYDVLVSGSSDLVDRASKVNPLVRALASQFPNDPAVLAPLFMQHVTLQPGEALVVPSLQPHCYLSGEAVECMNSSDNVVRAGLTSKHTDTCLFFSLACRRFEPPVVLPRGVTYSHVSLPFTVHRVSDGDVVDPGILLVLDGVGELALQNGRESTVRGDSWLVKTPCVVKANCAFDAVRVNCTPSHVV